MSDIRQQLRNIQNGLSGCIIRAIVGTGRDKGEKSEQAALLHLIRLQDIVEETSDMDIKVLAYDVDRALNYTDAADFWSKINDLIDKLDEVLGDG